MSEVSEPFIPKVLYRLVNVIDFLSHRLHHILLMPHPLGIRPYHLIRLQLPIGLVNELHPRHEVALYLSRLIIRFDLLHGEPVVYLKVLHILELLRDL